MCMCAWGDGREMSNQRTAAVADLWPCGYSERDIYQTGSSLPRVLGSYSRDSSKYRDID